MSRNWPDKKEQEMVFKVEATGSVKTLNKESEKPSKVGALGVRAREVQNEAGVGSVRAA